MTDANQELKILQRVRKLLDKAESLSRMGDENMQNEADTAIAMAQTLMMQHAIDEAMLARVQTGKPAPKPMRLTIEINNPFVIAKVTMLNGIADVNRCKAVRYPGRNGSRAVVFGFEDDAKFVEMLFTTLMLQLVAEQRCASRNGESTGAKWQNAFAWGFSLRVVDRLRENARISAATVTDTNNLLPVLIRDVETAFAREFPRLRTTTAKLPIGPGTGRGMAAGDRADISGGRNTVAGKKALGA